MCGLTQITAAFRFVASAFSFEFTSLKLLRSLKDQVIWGVFWRHSLLKLATGRLCNSDS